MTSLPRCLVSANLAAFTAFWALGGCTVAPKPVTSQVVYFSGNAQNSGIIGRLPNGSWEIDAATLARYDSLIAKGFGKGFEVPLKADDGVTKLTDGNYAMDSEHMVDFGVMNTLFKSKGFSP